MKDFLNDCGIVSDHDMGEYERNLIFNMQEVDFKMQEVKRAIASTCLQAIAA